MFYCYSDYADYADYDYESCPDPRSNSEFLACLEDAPF